MNKKARRFRSKGCLNYELLGLLFNGSTGTIVLQHSSAQNPPTTDDENELNDALIRFGVHITSEGSVGGYSVGDVAGSSQRVNCNRNDGRNPGVLIGGRTNSGKRSMSCQDVSRSRSRSKKEKDLASSYMSDALK